MSLKLHPGCFLGNNLRTYEMSEFILSECVYTPSARLAKHSHRNAYFNIILQGGYSENYGNKTRECPTQTVIFHPEGEEHEDSFFKEGGRIFRFEIKPQKLDQVRSQLGVLHEPAALRGGEIALLGAKLYKEFRQMDAISPLAIEGIALEMVAELSRRTKRREPGLKSPEWLSRARDLLRSQFTENLNFTLIAGELGIHPVYFSRAFRKSYGCTVGEYVRKLRIEAASRRLAGGDDPLVAIALDCGFCDQSHFTKTFKKATGLTPEQYRLFFRRR